MTACARVVTKVDTHRCECCAATSWGEDWQIGTAAFWVKQASTFPISPGRHRLGASLREELAVCMLGGYGIPGPVGNAAFVALRDAGLLTCESGEEVAERMSRVLAQPLAVGPRQMRYRFHVQRPRRLAAALSALSAWEQEATDLDDLELRRRLMLLPGVGPKTASWVVRNHRDSDAVAIIDIHVQRAGVQAGVFCAGWSLPRHYGQFESAFLDWAAQGAVSAANLDAAIWQLLSSFARRGRRTALGNASTLATDSQRLLAL